MPLVMLALVLLFVAGVGLLNLGMQSRLQAVYAGSEIAAKCAADAGLEKAIFEMNQKLLIQPWDDSMLPESENEALANCDATFSYDVDGDSATGFTVQSVGGCGRVVRSINCLLRLQGPFEFAVFGDQGVLLRNSAIVDWYNFDDEAESFSVGTNSTTPGAITLMNSAVVNGDVVIGPGGDPDVVVNSTWGNIIGETYVASELYELPQVTVPAELLDMPSGGQIKDNTTITQSGKYDEIDLGNSEILIINGNVSLYIIGNIDLGNSAEVQVVGEDTNPNASLTLFLGGNFEGKNSSKVNNLTENPRNLMIYGLDSCENMLFKNSGSFYGTIYARNANVVMYNSAEVHGAVVANSVELKNSANLNYDASLRDADEDDQLVRFVIRRWQEE
jgi:hypothetical protein